MDEQRKPVPARQLKKRKFANWWEVLFLIFFIGGGLWFANSLFSGMQSTSTSNQNSAPIVISATQLINDYANNQIAADDKYKNQNLEISGVVQSINTGILDSPYVVIAPNVQTFNAIECGFNSDQEQKLCRLGCRAKCNRGGSWKRLSHLLGDGKGLFHCPK